MITIKKIYNDLQLNKGSYDGRGGKENPEKREKDIKNMSHMYKTQLFFIAKVELVYYRDDC